MKRFLALLLVLGMLFSVLPVISAEKNTDASDIWDTINEIENEKIRLKRGGTVTPADYAAIVDDVIAAVEASDSYKEGTISRNGDFFFWETLDGEPNGYSPRLRARLRNSANAYADPEAYSGVETASYATGNSTNAVNVAVFQPYYGLDTSFTRQYQVEGESIAKTTGGTCKTYKTTSATVDAIADALESCAVVFFDSHGETDYENGDDCTSKANTSYILLQTNTGWTPTDKARVIGEYGTYYHAYNAGSYANMSYYCFDGTAIANHMEKSAPNNMLWMAICLGMATDGLNAPLCNKGVGVVYGYSQAVTFEGDYFWEETFWNAMRDEKTVSAAISAMKTKCGSWDYSKELYSHKGWKTDSDTCTTLAKAQQSHAAFPVVVSAEDAYPGHGNVDNLQTVKSTWTLKETLAPTYSFAAKTNNAACGTVYVNDNIIVPTPKPGCEVIGYTVSPSGAATVAREGTSFIVTDLTANCTITVIFEQKEPEPTPCDGGMDCPSYRFNDVNAGDWYHEAVDFAVTENLFQGMSETAFEPNTAMTRAMLVTVLYRAQGTPDVSGEYSPFADVEEDQWYYDAVIWAAKNGIVNGMSETIFAPDLSITREQIAAILYRYAGSPAVSGSLYQFGDAFNVSPYAVDAMTWAVSEGIISGIDGRLCPQDNATRAQIATILFRYLNR